MGADFAKFAGSVQDNANDAARVALIESGVEVIKGSAELEADLRKLGQPTTDKWIAQMDSMGVDGQAVIEHYLDRIAQSDAAMAN